MGFKNKGNEKKIRTCDSAKTKNIWQQNTSGEKIYGMIAVEDTAMG